MVDDGYNIVVDNVSLITALLILILMLKRQIFTIYNMSNIYILYISIRYRFFFISVCASWNVFGALGRCGMCGGVGIDEVIYLMVL